MFIESITPEELQKLEFASFPGKITVIDSVGAEFNRAIAYLRSQKVIGASYLHSVAAQIQCVPAAAVGAGQGISVPPEQDRNAQEALQPTCIREDSEGRGCHP